MVDYANSSIYIISCRDPSIPDSYIGSTTNLVRRKRDHEIRARGNGADRHTRHPVYLFIRDHGGWDNWEMKVIERFPCETKTELYLRERYYIEDLKPSLNRVLPAQTTREYYLRNRDRRLEYTRKYQSTHPNHRDAAKRMIECDCGALVMFGHRKKHFVSVKHKQWQILYDFIHS